MILTRVGSKLGSKPDVCCWNFGACYVLFTFINSGFTIIYLAVANTVVVTDTMTPNALFSVSACLCEIARKIAVASKQLAVSQLQLLCSVLCSCILFFVFIINYLLIEFTFILLFFISVTRSQTEFILFAICLSLHCAALFIDIFRQTNINHFFIG